MFSVFRHHVSVGSFTGMVADMVLLFVAVLLAGVTQAGVVAVEVMPAGAFQAGLTHSGLSEMGLSTMAPVGGQPFALHQMVLFAAQFALVVSLMYSFAGLYRPKPLGVPTL